MNGGSLNGMSEWGKHSPEEEARMTEPARKVEYRYPTDEEAEAAWEATHRTHRVTEDQGCVYCHTCGLTYWRRRKP